MTSDSYPAELRYDVLQVLNAHATKWREELDRAWAWLNELDTSGNDRTTPQGEDNYSRARDARDLADIELAGNARLRKVLG